MVIFPGGPEAFIEKLQKLPKGLAQPDPNLSRIDSALEQICALLLKHQAESFPDFFSAAFVSPEEEVFAGSVFEDLSPLPDAFGADSFLAAAL